VNLSPEIAYRLKRLGRAMAAEVRPSRPGRRAWVGVFPQAPTFDTFWIHHFEVDAELLAHYMANNYDTADVPLLVNEELLVIDNQLEATLARWIDDFTTLGHPAAAEYPR
jgi:hypothetical protein